MVHFCAVPGSSNQSNRDTKLSYLGLPNKASLKVWIHKIGRKNLPLNSETLTLKFVVIILFWQQDGAFILMNIPKETYQ